MFETIRQLFCRSLLLTFLASGALLAQVQRDVIIPPNEPFGDPRLNTRGRMNGNRVSESFENHGEIGFWSVERGNLDFSDWPKGSAHPYLDGIAIVVGAAVIDIDGNYISSVQANYREEVDRSPDLETIWGWQPIPGYMNPDRRPLLPAMSNDPTSWPLQWPDHPDWRDNQGNVEWNGRFGRGKFNAQLEAYYVMDDAIDKEFRYFPDAADTTRGGLGLRVAVRLYQWVHPLAQDAVFGEFWITNVGTQDIDSTGFGWWVDNGVGGTGFDHGLFDLREDLSIAFDHEDVGIWGGPAGIAGYGYLESPGIPTDLRDNDGDGITDERRDNDAGSFVENPLQGPAGTVIDPVKFFDWYGQQPKPHWEGDEDQDWVGFEDVNRNGVFDPGEAINDDVGSDGVGPEDLNYFGPDPDGTEGNGRPDQGEPNFGRTDNDESDQLGMTSFRMIDNPGHPNPQPNRFQPMWFSDDDTWWRWLSSAEIIPDPLNAVNLNMIFASGTFPLEAKRTERFSMVLSRTLGSGTDISAMLELKQTVQAIFNTDYQFAQPPIKPRLTAVPGDQKVTLFWDDIAEISQDPFLGRSVKDFSGYRIYKATDPNFTESTIITDEDGQAILKKPLAIFDLVDGFKGAHPILVNGAPYDMGNESGLTHRFEDTDVLNGVTYYYAVVAFDTGAVQKGLSPTENTTIIEVNAIGTPVFVDRNSAAVVPRVPSAGYREPTISGTLPLTLAAGFGTGTIEKVEVLNPELLAGEDIFRVSFISEQGDRERTVKTTNYTISKLEGETLTQLIRARWQADTAGVVTTGLFNGMVLTIKNDRAKLDSENTGWLQTDGNVSSSRGGLKVNVEPDSAAIGAFFLFPHSDIEVRFADQPITETVRGRGGRKFLRGIMVNLEAVAADTSILKISVIDEDSSDVFELENDAIEIWEDIGNKRRTYWLVRFRPQNPGDAFDSPGEGDIVQIATKKEFMTGDFFEFQTRGGDVDQDAAARLLEQGKVAAVPNPYIVTNAVEPGDPFLLGQERRLQFIHLPAQCTIRIFSLSGKLVDIIEVNNPLNDGHILWDLRSKEDLEIAPGIYIFHVKDKVNGATQIGRFAIIR